MRLIGVHDKNLLKFSSHEMHNNANWLKYYELHYRIHYYFVAVEKLLLLDCFG